MSDGEIASVVIVGAGQAGGTVARGLRANGFPGRVVLIGSEAHPPYERPPLSKAVLLGDAAPESTHLFTPDALAALDVDLRLGIEATAIDRNARTVALTDGETLSYDRLVLATGGRARRLDIPGAAGCAVHLLRDLDDAARLGAALAAARSVLVIGGGWIGLEVAAAARARAKAVTVLEAAPRLAGRGAHPALSDWLKSLHESHGVTVELGVRIARLEPRDGGAAAVLADGSERAGDVVVAGVGMEPNTGLAEAAGLDAKGGIATDAAGRTADPAVFAVGDVARWPAPGAAGPIRLDSWRNAQDRALACAKAILGIEPDPPAVPWFWSDQFDRNIQILGLADPALSPIERGRPTDGDFTWLFERNGRLAGAVAVDRPMDIKAAQRLMARAVPVDPARLADETVPLKALLKG